ncbi:GTP:AMP phosphotransferase AK3, mitochondrial-like [Photinus pyralis]|nr:GTP:AMP phosphotransferase AK3, mitochondrial-like [Photinus pyralis]
MSRRLIPFARPVTTASSNSSGSIIKSVLLGIPGQHKTKLADQIVTNFNFVHLCIPQIISGRARDGSTVSKVLRISRNLKLQVPDDYTVKFVTNEVTLQDDKSFVITGFPSTLNQANLFWKVYKLNMVIYPDYSSEDYVRILLEGSKRVADGDERMKLRNVRNVIKRYTRRIGPILKYYEREKVLCSCSASTESEMWEKVRNEISKRVGLNVKGEIKLA